MDSWLGAEICYLQTGKAGGSVRAGRRFQVPGSVVVERYETPMDLKFWVQRAGKWFESSYYVVLTNIEHGAGLAVVQANSSHLLQEHLAHLEALESIAH